MTPPLGILILILFLFSLCLSHFPFHCFFCLQKICIFLHFYLNSCLVSKNGVPVYCLCLLAPEHWQRGGLKWWWEGVGQMLA